MKNVLFKSAVVIILLGLSIVLFLFWRSTQIEVSVLKTPIEKSGISSKNIELLAKYGQKRVIFIDFSKPSIQKRLWVVEGDSVLLNTYVTHGENSGWLYARHFSNENGSHMSCVGEFLTLNTYNGQHGLSLQIMGLDSTNNNAYARKIVFHAADYATGSYIRSKGMLGRSHGCFATSKEANQLIIDLVKQKIAVKVLVVP
jgi:hypothetical protein